MIEHDLKERVKELQCLYGLARIVDRPGITLDELYQEVVNLLPSSWQYPEITCARITSNGTEFKTKNYRETRWKQSSDIAVYGAKTGVVEVNYLEARPSIDKGSFLKEERQLLNTVAEQLGKALEYKQAAEALLKTSQRLVMLQQVTAAVHSTLDLEKVFKEITDRAVHSLGYTTAFILTLNDKKKCFEIKAISTKKRLLSHIDKILGFSLRNLSVPADPKLNPVVESVMKGRVAVVKNLTDIAYPLISKKACSALQKLGRTKDCIVIPLQVREEIVGGLFVTSSREEISEEELRTLETFARVSSDATKNANLLTESKQAEEALRQSEENLRTYLEKAPDGVYPNDLKGTFLYGNKKTEAITGHKREELTGKSFLKLKLLPKKYLAKASKLLALNAIGRPTGPDEFELIRKDGSRVWVEINTTPIKQHGEVVVLGFVRDMTERKQAEEALWESEERFRIASQIASDVVYERDLQTGIATFYGDIDSHVGYEPSEYPRTMEGWREHVHPEDLAWIDRQSIDQLEPGVPYSIEYRMRKKGGTYMTWFDQIMVIRAKKTGKPLKIIGAATDITERKRAEERVKQLLQQLNLSSRLASVGEMASGIAHEINNPLTGVIGFAQLLMQRDIPEDIRKDVEIINNGAQRVASIVSRLLTFARQHKPGREYVNINDAITSVLELRSYEMKVNNIEVVTQLAPHLPQTMADANQLQQVFLNIIINAEKEMTAAHRRGKLSVKTERTNSSIRVSFTDDGPGISKENLDKVFNPFFTTREVGDGTGLGLSICHGIITQHNGRIYAQSELGKGATFVVELPIVAKTVQLEKTKATQEAPWQRSGAKILVVDDEKSILDFLNHLLTGQGYQVETVDRTRAALTRLRRERYDLILLDIKLPGKSGIWLYRHIEAMDPALAHRVLFITGDVMETTTREFLDKTKVRYIAKPLNVEQLKRDINHMLTRELLRQQS